MAPAHSLFLSIALPPKDAMAKVRGPLPSPPPDKYEPHEIALPLSPPQRLMTTQPLPCPDSDVLPAGMPPAQSDPFLASQDVLSAKPHHAPRMQLLPSPPYDDDTPLPTQSPVLPPPSTSPPHTSPPLARHKLSPLPSVALSPPSPTVEEAPMPEEPSIPIPTYTLPLHFVQEKAALTRLLQAAQEQDRRGKARDMELNARLTWISERMKACHAAERERLAEEAKAPACSISCPTRSTASPSMLFGCDAPLDPAAVYAQEVSSLKREETQVKLNKSEERKKRKLAQERIREVQSFLAAREADEDMLVGHGEVDVDEDRHDVPTMGGLGIFTDSVTLTTTSKKKNGPVPVRFLVPMMLMRRRKEAGSRPLGTRCRDKAALARVRRGSSPLGRLLPGVSWVPAPLAGGKAPTAASDEADQMLDGADGDELADDEELLDGEDEEVEAMDRLLGYGLALSSDASRTTSTSSSSRALPAIRIPTLLTSDPGATCFPLPVSPLSPPSPSTELPMTSSMFCAVRVMPSKLSVLSSSSSPPSPVASIAPSTPALRSSFDDSSGSDSDTEEDEKDVEDLGFDLAFDEPESEKDGREEGWVDVELHATSSTFAGALSPPASPARPFMALPGTAASLSPPPSPRRHFPLLRMSVAPSSPKHQPTPISPDHRRGRSLHKTPTATKTEKIEQRGGGAFVGGVARRVVYGGSWMDPSSYGLGGLGRSSPSKLRGGERYAIGGDMLMAGVLGVGADECGGGSM